MVKNCKTESEIESREKKKKKQCGPRMNVFPPSIVFPLKNTIIRRKEGEHGGRLRGQKTQNGRKRSYTNHNKDQHKEVGKKNSGVKSGKIGVSTSR